MLSAGFGPGRLNAVGYLHVQEPLQQLPPMAAIPAVAEGTVPAELRNWPEPIRYGLNLRSAALNVLLPLEIQTTQPMESIGMRR